MTALPKTRSASPLRWDRLLSRPAQVVIGLTPRSHTLTSAATMLDGPPAWLDSNMQTSYMNSSLSNHPSLEIQRFGPSTSSQGRHSPSVAPPSESPSSSSPSASSQSPHPKSACDSTRSTRASSSNPPRKRIRPKIALDPSQPPTARGKPRARVYVACNQW